MVSLAALRNPVQARRVAVVLWIVFALLVWNVVFDHVLEVAGREFLRAAAVAAAGGSYARIDDWMRPAVTRGLWTASAAAGAVMIAGLAGVRVAAARARRDGLGGGL